MQLPPDDAWYVPLRVPVIVPLAPALALSDATSAAPFLIVWLNEKLGKWTDGKSLTSLHDGVLHRPQRRGRARRDADLVVDMLNVMIGRLRRDEEPVGNLLRREAASRQS